MCMLTGINAQSLSKEERLATTIFLHNLLLKNGKANRDGTGLGNAQRVIKWESPSAITTPKWSEAALEMLGDLPLIGHVRTASAGTSDVEGAHPFQKNGIVLAHNGTFSGWQGVDLESVEIGANDSATFLNVLASKVSEEALSADHIEEALGELSGSYALLIRYESDLWVVRGRNSLYHAQYGPLQVVNTSEANLKSVASKSALMTEILTGKRWELSSVERIGARTISKLKTSGMEEIEDIAYTSTTSVYDGTRRDRRIQRGYWTSETGEKTEQARQMARAYHTIKALPHIEMDLVLGSHVLFATSWYKIQDPSKVKYLAESLNELYEEHLTEEKSKLWGEILENSSAPYETISDEELIIKYPFVLNTVENLHTFNELLKEMNNV